MSKEISQIKKAEIITELVNQLTEARKNIALNFLLIGKILHQIKKEKLYASYASHIQSFLDFLKEVKIKRSTAYHCMAVYKEFGQYLLSNPQDIPFRRLIKLLPVAKENKEEWLLKAKELPEKAFEDEIREAQGKLPSDKCDHPEDQRMYFYQCKLCKKWVKIKKSN